jgi:hypothetical protein
LQQTSGGISVTTMAAGGCAAAWQVPRAAAPSWCTKQAAVCGTCSLQGNAVDCRQPHVSAAMKAAWYELAGSHAFCSAGCADCHAAVEDWGSRVEISLLTQQKGVLHMVA